MTNVSPFAWHADERLLAGYAAGTLPAPEAASVDAHAMRCPSCRARVGSFAPAGRLAANLEVVLGEVFAPRPGRAERALLRLRVPEPTARLMASTPALRRSWLVAVGVAVLFAANAANDTPGQTPGRLAIFLTIAPLIPLLGVALAFGPGVDPTYETAVAAPLSGFRLLLVRAVTVLGSSIGLLGLATLLSGHHGLLRLAWLVPALGVSLSALALSSRLESRRAAAVIGGLWVLAVVVAGNVTGDPVAVFRAAGQFALGALAVAAATTLVAARHRFDTVPGAST